MRRAVAAMACGCLLLVTARADAEVTCREVDGALELVRNGTTVLRYHTAVAEPPEGIAPVFRRSGFIHPVFSPSGRVVTSGFPADHAHQHGIFSAWVHTTFEGRKVDFWNQAGRTGNVEHVRVDRVLSQPEGAEFRVELNHVDLTGPNGQQPVLREFWTVRLQDRDGPIVFDIESRQTCIASSPLTVHKYHYGGMAFRGSDQWFAASKTAQTDFEFVTSEGLDRKQGNHTRPKWVIARGSVDGQPCGIAIMGHPSNPQSPEPVRLHDTKPYFVFSPCVLGEFVMEPGVEQVRRYRYVVFDGPADPEKLEQAWQEFRQ